MIDQDRQLLPWDLPLRAANCRACNGSGNCSTCGGTGTRSGVDPKTKEPYVMPCLPCGTTGKCSNCGGSGTK